MAGHRLLALCVCMCCLGQAQATSSSSSKGSAGGNKRSWKEFLEDEEAINDYHDFAKKLFLANKLSAQEAQKLLQKSQKAGAQGPSLKAQHGNVHNAMRLMMNHCKKTCTWPDFYWAEVKVKDLKTQGVQTIWLPFLLPHEWLHFFFKHPLAWQEVKPETGSRHEQHVTKIAQGMPVTGIVPLGLHGDGVPIQGTLNEETLDTLSLNLPTSRNFLKLRIPFTMLERKFVLSKETWDDILLVFCWSMRHAWTGNFPTKRHDGSPWRKSDKNRQKLPETGKMRFRALLCEIRGDWDFYESLLKFPAWNKLDGMCWLCHHTKDSYKQGSFQPEPMTTEEFLARNRISGKDPCVLFGLPGVGVDICRPDWMHTCDLGIAADIMGHVFVELLPEMPGRAEQIRLQGLWKAIQEYYAVAKPSRQLRKLTLSMFKPKKAAPKLHGTALEIRCLIPFLPPICNKYWSHGTEHQKTVCHLVTSLAACYEALAGAWTGSPELPQKLRHHGERVFRLYLALEHEATRNDPTDTKTWRVKPKLHLFQHLCIFGDYNPKEYHCYEDEKHQGDLADLGEVRGGPARVGARSHRALQRWTGLHACPMPPT